MTPPLAEHAFALANRRGDTVWGDVRYLAGAEAAPAVVFCHGFKGFKDWGPFPLWGRRLAEAGFVSVHVNFSFNGVAPETPDAFTRLDRFAQNTLSRELDDLQAVLDGVAAGCLGRLALPVDPARIGLMGHSRGGGIVVVQAARDARVRALATWAAVAGFVERFTPEQVEAWQRQGYTEVLNSRTGQRMRLDRAYYDDALAHRDALDVTAAAARVRVPWLVVHADDDEAVPVAEAEQLHRAQPRARFVRASGGHTFGGRHPFDGDVPPDLAHVFDATVAFFQETLGASPP